MTKFFWVDTTLGDDWSERKGILTSGLESGASGAMVKPEDIENAAKLGDVDLVVSWSESLDLEALKGKDRILLVGRGAEGDGTKELSADLNDSGDMARLNELNQEGVRTCGYVEIASKAHERLAAEEAKGSDFIMVVGKDWKIIPLENLIAELQKKDVAVMAGVKDAEEARLAFETLEVGVDGVLLQTKDVNEVKKVAELLTKGGKFELKPARITKLKQVGMGDRVCVDTASLLKIGQGMLVGSQASGLFLVHSETLETEYVASRPFRVNAG
ncbi:MAG: 3-dehydroquinate synthase II, partial [Candidatus Hydrothermarchaeales archaeon]